MAFATYRACLDAALDVMAKQDAVFGKIAECVAQSENEIIVTAIGKSGYVGQKFAASLRSVGIPAYFLHAAEAGHGDIGNVVEDQIVFAISKSGTTAEINKLLPDLKARNCTLVAITNRDNSPLAEASSYSIITGVQDEGGPVGDVPLVSTEAALFACDYLVALITEMRQFTKDDFLYNHPAGQIGTNLRYRIADYIDLSKRENIRIAPDETVMNALLATTRGRMGAVAVVDEAGKVCGYLSDGDFRRLIGRGIDINSTIVRDVMNVKPVVIGADMRLGDVLGLFERADTPIGSAPVTDESGCFLGVISIHDLIGSK